MTRQVHEMRYRKLAIAAFAVIAGAGLTAPVVFYRSTFNDMSLASNAVIAATRDSFTLTSPLALPLMPNVMIETGRLSVSGSDPAKPLTGAEMVALLSAGKAKLVLDDAMLSLVPTQSTGAKKDVDALAPVLAALLNASFSQLELRNAIVQLGRGEDERAFLTDVTLEVTKLDPKQVRVVGSFAFRKRGVNFDIVMGIEPELQEKKNDGKGTIGRTFDIKLTSDLLELKAAGTLSAGDQPQLSSSTSTLVVSDLRKMARWIGVELGSGGGLSKFEARGPIEFSPSAIAFSDATFSLDGNEATGTFTFIWGGRKRPAIDGTLAFKTFDIAPFFAPSGNEGQASPPPFSVADYLSLSTSRSSVLPLAEQIDADLRISATNISAGATRFGRGAASFSLKDGMLLADLAELEIAKGARCGGQFGLHINGGVPHYALRGKIESIDIAMLTNALWSYNVLSGTGDVTLDLKANGQDVDQIIATMNGKIGVRQAGNGQIGLDLRTLAATARAQTQKGWGGAIRGQTVIQGLNADFAMLGGLLVAEQVSARAGDAALSVEGSVNFGDRVGNVKVWITHPTADGAQPAADPTSTKPDAAPIVGTASASAAAPPAEASATQKAAARAPGGGLHVLGPLDAPEIRFVPVSPASAGNAVDPQSPL